MTDPFLAGGKPDPRAPVPDFVGLHERDREIVARGVEHYCTWLDSVAAEEEKQGRLEVAAMAKGDAAYLRGALVIPILGDEKTETMPTGILEVQYRHIRFIHIGLGRYVTRLKAARGTLKPLGYQKTIDRMETDANYIEKQFQPRFAEQGELLPLEPPPLHPPADQVDGRTLKELAELDSQ